MALAIRGNVLRRLSLRARAGLLVALVMVGLVLLMVLDAISARGRMFADREHLVKTQVQSAVAIARQFHQRAENGQMSEDAARKAALDAIAGMRWDGGTGYVFAFDSNMIMRMHPIKPQLVGKNMSATTDPEGRHLFRMMLAVDRKGGGFTRYGWPKPGVKGVVDKVSYSQWYKPWDLHFGAGSYVDDVESAFHHMLAAEIGEAGLVAALVLLALLLVVRSVLRTIGGEPATAQHMAARIADGDLRPDADESRFREDSLLASLVDMRRHLTGLVAAVQEGAGSVSLSAQHISQGNDDLSQRTQELATSLEETAASMEEMTATVRQNAESASAADRLAEEARGQAREGSDTVARAIAAMGEIDASSQRIGDIVGLIDEIAFQTNLLALNAAVEAARAGEHGRGFAVVAGEVRTLSQRSASAAREIKALITDSGDKVAAGSELVRASGGVLEGIVERVAKVHQLVADIAAASREQSNGIDQVNQAVTQIDQVTQRNAALVEEAAAASHDMQSQAETLRQQAAYFRIEAETGDGDAHAGVDDDSAGHGPLPEAA